MGEIMLESMKMASPDHLFLHGQAIRCVRGVVVSISAKRCIFFFKKISQIFRLVGENKYTV